MVTDRLEFIANPREAGIERSTVRGFWNSVQDVQHDNQIAFDRWKPALPAPSRAPSQRLPAAPPAQPRDPAALKKDARYYWYRPAEGSFHNSINRFVTRWPGPPPADRVHLAPYHDESGEAARLEALRLCDEDARLELRRQWTLQQRSRCFERTLSRTAHRVSIEALSGQTRHLPRSATRPELAASGSQSRAHAHLRRAAALGATGGAAQLALQRSQSAGGQL
jgi:hypothetical protein